MFDTLFKYPRVLARHREGPVADARERFLAHCAEHKPPTRCARARQAFE
jgi:hypothetical protein